MAYDKALVQKAAAETGVPEDLLQRVIAAESSGDPKAVSYRGAKYGEGLMQLSEAVAKDEGVTDRTDPWQSILGGAKDIRSLLDRFGGKQDLAMAAYVAGPEKVQAAGGVPSYARDYVRKVTGKMPQAATGETAGGDSAAPLEALLKHQEAQQTADDAAFKSASADASAANKELASQLKSLGGELKDVDAYLDKLRGATPAPKEEVKLPGYQPPAQKNPLQPLAAVMPIMLMAGSKMGRNKNLALMKSMSGMLNGVNEGNDATRKQYQEDFKAKTEQALHQAQLDHEHYMDVLESISSAKGDALAKAQVVGAITQNANWTAAAKSGDLKQLVDFVNMHQHGTEALATTLKAIIESHQRAVENKYREQGLAQDQEKIDETKRYHEEQSPLKRAQFAEKLRNDLDKSPLGKAYATLDQYDHAIENAAQKAEHGEKVGSMEQSQFLDAYTRIITGGQAIRGFTLKLNTEHASLADKANVWLQQLKTGGPLSPRQIKEATSVIREYAKQLEGEYKGAIDRADQFARQSGVIGDDQTVTPFEVDPSKLAGAGGGAGGTEPMPARKEDLVAGHHYNVPGHGPMTWDGSNFVG